MMAALRATATLTLVYALTVASFAPWDLAFGALLSAALLLAFRRMLRAPVPSRRPPLLTRAAGLMHLGLALLKRSVVGARQVLLVTLHLRKPRPALVAIALDEHSEHGVAASALLVALTPGTLLVEVDADERVMWLHAIDTRDPEAVRRGERDLYERHQARVFP